MLFVTVVFPGISQEIWMLPDKYSYNVGEKAVVIFETGSNFTGDPTVISKIEAGGELTLHHDAKLRNLSDSIRIEEKSIATCTLHEAGTNVLCYRNVNLQKETDADTFNQILKDYELETAIKKRQQNNTASLPAKESFSVFSKAILLVGNTHDETYRKLLGWPLEILASKNPGSLKVGDQLRFKVLVDGKPAFGIRAKLWNRFDNRTTIQNIYTEKDGTFEARISSPGPWMVTVMTIAPSTEPGAEWRRNFASYLFGVQ
jgi:hypothetical protein